MQLNINIEDAYLQKQITHYISDKHIQANDFMVELLEHFFKKEETLLKYKIQSPEKKATTIDFNLESETAYKLFEDVNDVESYAKKLRCVYLSYKQSPSCYL
ncbi:MAG: Unknown protein [uncultured Sulfurovum sp.]|uniref:Uncharacterized protein n=1 Tax=uncultured Sulfurovum sp. TaxID=269237 RepID=A0A6S6SBB2_9BACT|nr:MAG: Unknown protein [uncultured Sulfurovum sp.]